MKIIQLRTKHPSIHYKNYNYQIIGTNLKLKFTFSLKPNIVFNPYIEIKDIINKQNKHLINSPILDKFIFNLGLIELFSYWKCAAPNQIVIECGSIIDLQNIYWHNLLINGMGEFFYKNKIDFTDSNFVKFISKSKVKKKISAHNNYQIVNQSKILIPVGGGKDSATSLGILDKNKLDYDCLILNPTTPAAQQLAQLSNANKTININRKIDPQLIELNKLGYLNGHTPFSALLAHISSLVAWLNGNKLVLVANEASANQENIVYKNTKINHQYSKTYDFEQKFNTYLNKFIISDVKNNSKKAIYSSNLTYKSLIRPLNELQIGLLFSQFTKFHSIFRSCNIGQKQGIWCHQCPKCLFVFLILYPFIEYQTLTTKIFNRDLFKDKKLLPDFKKLLNIEKIKPFECVGTYQECQASYWSIIKKYDDLENLPFLLKATYPQMQSLNKPKSSLKDHLNEWNKNNLLSSKFKKIIKNELKQAILNHDK